MVEKVLPSAEQQAGRLAKLLTFSKQSQLLLSTRSPKQHSRVLSTT